MATGGVPRLFSLATFLLAGSQATAAWAAGPNPDKMECIAADTDGQALRITGSLLRARKRLAVCAAASCPGIVREDCLQRIAELDVAQPTVVFSATNGRGRPLVAVRVIVDGTTIAERLDGRPLPVDPGTHLFVFEALGRVTAQMRLSFEEGEKNVAHAAVLPTGSGDPVDRVPAPEPAATQVGDDLPADLQVSSDSAVPSATPASASGLAREGAPPLAVATPEDTTAKWRMAAIGAGGVGVAGVVVGSIFGLLTASTWSAATNDCHNNVCPPGAPGQSDQSRERIAAQDGTISTVAFVTGGVGLAVAAWFWFAPPESSKSPSAISVLPVVGPSQGQLLIRRGF
jgi:hypothetical protein